MNGPHTGTPKGQYSMSDMPRPDLLDNWSTREMTDWLFALSAKGGKGVVANVDARALGRAARMILRLERERLHEVADGDSPCKKAEHGHHVWKMQHQCIYCGGIHRNNS